MTFRYTPGSSDWVGLVSDECAVLIGGAFSHDLIDALWARLADGAPGLLEQLTSAGLQATPPFVLVEPAEDGTRVIVRGPTTVSVSGESITGAGAATWIERVLPPGRGYFIARRRAVRVQVPWLGSRWGALHIDRRILNP